MQGCRIEFKHSRKYGAIVSFQNFVENRKNDGLVELDLLRLGAKNSIEGEALGRSDRQDFLSHEDFLFLWHDVDDADSP